jgi:hypothetical protein
VPQFANFCSTRLARGQRAQRIVKAQITKSLSHVDTSNGPGAARLFNPRLV